MLPPIFPRPMNPSCIRFLLSRGAQGHSSLSAPPASRIGFLGGPATPLARALDADKMAKLGIRNTMRLAKAYNGLRRGRRQRMRKAEFSRWDRAAERPMQDGFLLDTSMSLPHLDELLAQAEEVIGERAGRTPADD